ncbi:patatin-like phospholipase family protein [Bacillus xiapuensis]|uniref:patatin-like phospholipase family protein n=1 Tax=Bacillus xiapuensis TaxID=2014075 RepID=UPI000C23F0C7|nr:patatin family protein [Bacillus xiapuensis]
MKQVGLVLEGGGMRGLYTAGVLEYFLERELYFPYTIGVSAGACMAATYASRQKGRNAYVNIELAQDPRFVSFRNFLRNREIFGMDFLFDEIPNALSPFDFQTFQQSEGQFWVGATDCLTGEAVYYNKQEHGKDILTIIRASSSLPFIASPVKYHGRWLLDGGIADPIPLKKSLEDGMDKSIVVMTKPKRMKRPPSKWAQRVNRLYRQFPVIAAKLNEHYQIYNQSLTYLSKESQWGRAYVIQPSVDLPVSRIERKKYRLQELYDLGYHDAKAQFSEMMNWMNQ